MASFLVAADADIDWRAPEDLPSDRLVLARTTHFSGAQPPRLIFARALEDGVALGSGGDLNMDWAVSGWVDTDLEISLRPAAATAAVVRPLSWEEYAPGSWWASDGLGGGYTYTEGKRHLRCIADTERRLDAGTDPRDAARAHHEARLRDRISNSDT